MRTLIVGALSASLVGCSCYVAPQPGADACTGADIFACLDGNSGSRQWTAPEPSSGASATTPKDKAARGAATKRLSALSGSKPPQRGTAARSTPDAAKIEHAAAVQPLEASDRVMDRAKIAVTAELEDPGSATFSEMNRSMRKNLQGQLIDTICGHVKSKKASGEDTGDRAFLYLVKEGEAYVVDSSPTSVASTVYGNICK